MQPAADRWRAHPSILRLHRLAILLGDLNARVVYIGGAIAPILQVQPPFSSARATKDIDAIAATGSYSEHGFVQDHLRILGFREDVSQGAHAHRWIGPDGLLFDLTPARSHMGASGQRWDELAVETAALAEIAPGITIRHASAPAFLAQKWAAYHDRGARDPFSSHDLEDIVSLIASRPMIAADVANAPPEIAAFVRAESRTFQTHPDFEDLLAGNLAHAFEPAQTIAVVRERLREIGLPA